jgi:hypothetical protein
VDKELASGEYFLKKEESGKGKGKEDKKQSEGKGTGGGGKKQHHSQKVSLSLL